MKLSLLLSTLALIASFNSTPMTARAEDATLRLGGATSLAKAIKAKQTDIESQAGVKLIITANGSAQGLADLQANKVDVAMTGGPIAGLVDEYNKKNPNSATPLKSESFKDFAIFNTPLNIIVNKNVPVTTLTTDQLRDVLTGKICNWKDLGGTDLEIKVVLPPIGDGGRTQIQYELLKDQSFTSNKREAKLQPEVVKIVSQLDGAISFVSAQNTNDTVAIITLNKALAYTLSLVTLGEPNAEQQKVIDATKNIIGKK